MLFRRESLFEDRILDEVDEIEQPFRCVFLFIADRRSFVYPDQRTFLFSKQREIKAEVEDNAKMFGSCLGRLGRVPIVTDLWMRLRF